jgi:hypothetical protein
MFSYELQEKMCSVLNDFGANSAGIDAIGDEEVSDRQPGFSWAMEGANRGLMGDGMERAENICLCGLAVQI